MVDATASSADRSNAPKSAKPGLLKRVGQGLVNAVRTSRDFLRESVAELRRVVWPTKTQVTTYTWVVLTFVVIMALLIFVIDYAAGQGVLFIFGS